MSGMKHYKKIPWLMILVCLPLIGAYTVKGGKVMNVEEVATLSVQEHHSLLLEAMQGQNWQEMIHQANIIIKNFPDTPFYQESFYFLAKAYFSMRDFDIANQHLSNYLKKQTALQHFRDAIELKFQIAEKFRDGYKKHIGGLEMLPKWMPAKDEAVKIYDEVISALPNDDLAAKALYGKGILLLEDQEYTASVETYQTLIRKFPKHPLTPDAYVEIARVYLTQSKDKYPDADYLDSASINLRKFRQDFPMDARVEEAEKIYGTMQEVFAESFYEIAQFYERAKKPHASILYYSKIIKTFPNTKSAELSKKRLKVLRPPEEPKSNETQSLPVPEPESGMSAAAESL
jgi:outer membrane protein assembly factor BamD (BamD/ComL family)